MKKAPSKKGFAMSLEALCSVLLLMVAASAMEAFSFPPQKASDFYLCSDAALFLSKLSSSDLQAQVDTLSRLSGRCISFESEKSRASSCDGAQIANERLAFTIAVFEEGSAGTAQVSCWLQE